MATNDFKPFATGAGANVMSQADWVALPALLSGFMAGKANSAQVNKAIRQASFIAAALAQYTVNKTGQNVLDDGDLNGFITKMTTAFGKDFQALDATLTALAGLVGAANKLAYFNGADTAALTDLTQVGRDIIGKSAVADVLTYLQLRESFTGVVGQSRNAVISITAASATATFSADELIVEESSKRQYRLSAFNKSVNLATTGAGGMDTGVAPATGFVALYAIYNPTTDTSALLAVNATSAIAPEIYSGANMPAGYTASALVSVWGTASSQFIAGFQTGRTVRFVANLLLNTTSAPTSSPTAFVISAAVPKNAKAAYIIARAQATSGTGGFGFALSSDGSGIGRTAGGWWFGSNTAIDSPANPVGLITPQTIFYYVQPGFAAYVFSIYCSGYDF